MYRRTLRCPGLSVFFLAPEESSVNADLLNWRNCSRYHQVHYRNSSYYWFSRTTCGTTISTSQNSLEEWKVTGWLVGEGPPSMWVAMSGDGKWLGMRQAWCPPSTPSTVTLAGRLTHPVAANRDCFANIRTDAFRFLALPRDQQFSKNTPGIQFQKGTVETSSPGLSNSWFSASLCEMYGYLDHT